jgi:DtxR family transcriptional regulator, Mn-dependent transcriptional regulator
VTESLEMYLETISLLREKTRMARVTDIARELGVSKPSVHAALHELERRGLIEHEHYGEVFLSPAGKDASAEIRRRHELLTAFLRNFVGVNPEIAERDACRIEHYLSKETMDRIADIAGAASADPARPGPAKG